MKKNKIIIQKRESIKKSKNFYTLAKKGLMISLCGFILTKVSSISAGIYYSTGYDNLIDEIEKNPDIVLRLNSEEEKTIAAYKNNELSQEEYEEKIEEINSNEHKIKLAEESNNENYNSRLKELNISKKVKDGFAVGSSVAAISCAGFGIVSLKSLNKKEENIDDETSNANVF